MGSEANLAGNLSFSQPDFYFAAIKTFSVLSIILALILIGFYLVRRYGPNRSGGVGGNRWVKLISVTPIAPKKMIGVVEVAGELLVVGLTEQQITLLTKVTNEQMIDHLKKHQTGGSSDIPFYQQFKSLLGKHSDISGGERDKEQPLFSAMVSQPDELTHTTDNATALGSKI